MVALDMRVLIVLRETSGVSCTAPTFERCVYPSLPRAGGPDAPLRSARPHPPAGGSPSGRRQPRSSDQLARVGMNRVPLGSDARLQWSRIRQWCRGSLMPEVANLLIVLHRGDENEMLFGMLLLQCALIPFSEAPEASTSSLRPLDISAGRNLPTSRQRPELS
eukprot:scaffold1435_cov267-Pinguiococcus_pyrenoidosus.AAC.12